MSPTARARVCVCVRASERASERVRVVGARAAACCLPACLPTTTARYLKREAVDTATWGEESVAVLVSLAGLELLVVAVALSAARSHRRFTLC